ncbi:WecB/TagA/CpsF family glycosyltransferase [Litorimonas haliclonae]|uniref:WecB/TagA/CpsF family glycosyltransferase n=1 Tax=Litorimonas haliclonae TaxID=2081977 RepID=UPI0039F13225
MGATKHIVPPVPRGEDRRLEQRDGQVDWRINQRSYDFIGATFDPLTPMQTLARAKWMTMNHGFRFIVTPNVDHLVRLAKEPEVFKPLYEASWLSVCDSRILELLAAISGIPLKAVPGSDLTQQLFDNVITSEDKINIIGADEEIVETVKSIYGLDKVNIHQPPMGMRYKPQAIADAAEFVAKHPARYTFICVGSPQQEMVAKACLERGDCVGLGLCVGASLDFLSGRTKRAPKWMQNMRLEWLFRLGSEPKRLWKRYLLEAPKIFYLWIRWIFKRKTS